MSDRVDMTIRLPDLTPAQAIALHAMFNWWHRLGVWGSSRMVAFMVDGDGNFRPRPEIKFSEDIYGTMTEEQKQDLWKIAHTSRPQDDDTTCHPEEYMEFDFDPIAWKLRQ